MPTDLWYLDASAVVKLVMPEQGAETFRAWLDTIRAHQADGVVSDLVRTEVVRAVQRRVPRLRSSARIVTQSFQHISLPPGVFDAAADVEPAALRTLDAIHLAAARLLGPVLAGIVTYDLRLAEAAAHQGIVTISP